MNAAAKVDAETRYRRRAGPISYVAPVIECLTVGATRPVPTRRSP